jgi:hypothetical protein
LSQVQLELEQLSRLIATHRELIEKCRTVHPSGIELSGLAAMLHSYDCGIENLWKRITIECDGQLHAGREETGGGRRDSYRDLVAVSPFALLRRSSVRPVPLCDPHTLSVL